MASIQQRGKGSFLIQFYDRDGRKRGVSISGTTKKFAQSLAVRIEALNAAQRSGHSLDGATAQWLNEIGDTLAGKLAKVGLIEPRSVKTLGEFLDEYFKSRKDWKPATVIRHTTTKNHLLTFFPADKPLREFTEADADAFVRYLKNDIETMKSTATRSKNLSNVKEYFRAAVRRRLIAENPFDSVSLPKHGANRFYYVTQEEAGKVFDACPDSQWRLLFALARYGGLRIPSEIQGLMWSHVLWEENKILIHSPKTEHHDGKATRLIPIFPELRPYLEDAREVCREGERYVITAARNGAELSAAYIRKRMLEIIKRSGVLPWPKIFQNCRSTRQTELEHQYPSHVVCAWMGNTEKVSRKHYLQVTEDDFQKGAGITAAPPTPGQGEAIPPTADAEKVMLQMMTQIAENAGEGGIDAKLMLSNILQNPAFSRVFSPSLVSKIGQAGPDTNSLKALLTKILENLE